MGGGRKVIGMNINYNLVIVRMCQEKQKQESMKSLYLETIRRPWIVSNFV